MATISSLCIDLLSSIRTSGEKAIDGVNLSPHPSIGIYFEGYGEDEETGEANDTDVEKYTVVIHTHSVKPKFHLSSENRIQWGNVCIDSSFEVPINGIYDLQTASWHINVFSSSEYPALSQEDVVSILTKLLSKSKKDKSNPNPSGWPFAVAPLPKKNKL